MSFVDRLLSPSKTFLHKILGKNPIDGIGTSETESSADEIHNSDQTEELSLIEDLRNSE